MLVVISDLHLTDGSSGETISPGAFQIFAQRVRDLAVQASWRVDGNYRPIERIDLVLLGDVLDVIRSTQWSLAGEVRPWTNAHRPEFVDTVTKITSDILRFNDSAIGVLRSLSAEGAVTVPPALERGRPALDAPGQPVPVRTHYVVGNHDWMFHLPGSNYDLLRQALVRHLGLANPPNEPFPHDPVESEELLAAMRRHRLFARHGDLYDPFNFEGDRDTSSLGDVIVIELLNRFAYDVEQELSQDLPVSTIMGLREIDNVRPLLMVPVWIDGLLERTCSIPSQRKSVKLIWDRLADEFLSLNVVRQRDTWNPNDLVDRLERMLKFSKRISIDGASAILQWMNELRIPAGESYYRNALAEQDFRNRRAKHIVYGHTHQSETIPLDASFADGYTLNQVYFNSGTWRRVHRQTTLAPGEHEFIAADVMTYLAFFQGDERAGRPYETWSGTLGIQPLEVPFYRIDPGEPRHAHREPLSASTLSSHAPHFTPQSVDTASLSLDG